MKALRAAGVLECNDHYVVGRNSLGYRLGPRWRGVPFRSVRVTNPALLRKLVEKGILTEAEAGELKVQSDQGFSTAYASRTGMPEWVNSLKISGDFRGRFNVDTSANEAYVTRSRWRYRARLGFVAALLDDLGPPEA